MRLKSHIAAIRMQLKPKITIEIEIGRKDATAITIAATALIAAGIGIMIVQIDVTEVTIGPTVVIAEMIAPTHVIAIAIHGAMIETVTVIHEPVIEIGFVRLPEQDIMIVMDGVQIG